MCMHRLVVMHVYEHIHVHTLVGKFVVSWRIHIQLNAQQIRDKQTITCANDLLHTDITINQLHKHIKHAQPYMQTMNYAHE